MAADEKREVILSYEENNSPNLLQMGGAKKRKRDTSPDKDTCDDVEPDNNDERLQTPRPSVFSRLSMKRTSSEAFGGDDFSDNSFENRSKPQMNFNQKNDGNKRRHGRRPLKKRNTNQIQRDDQNQRNDGNKRRHGRRPLKKRNINKIQRDDQNQHNDGNKERHGRRPQHQKGNLNTAQRNDQNQHNEADMNVSRGRIPQQKQNIDAVQRNDQNQHNESDMKIPRRKQQRPRQKRNVNKFQRNNQNQHNEAGMNVSNPEENLCREGDSQSQSGNRPQQGKFRSKNRRPKKKNKNNAAHTRFSNDNYMPGSSSSGKRIKQDTNEASFQPYDYSSVDFKAFQGGAERAHKPQQIKSNFRGKGRRRRGNRGNRQSVFGNVKGNRQGR